VQRCFSVTTWIAVVRFDKNACDKIDVEELFFFVNRELGRLMGSALIAFDSVDRLFGDAKNLR